MEPNKYVAEMVGGQWIVALVSESNRRVILWLGPEELDERARRIAALLNMGMHLSTEKLESGGYEIIRKH